ncbi:MAG: hypothetical protein IKY44_00925 [Clostridia bacterium]|nr:hypothetical protein [Clostridia bacterium]
MKLIKVIALILCACVFVSTLAACTNNLSEGEWDDYTCDTDVYYSTTTTTATTVMEDVLREYNIPSYWADELKATVEDSLAAINNSRDNHSAFIWYSDAHWSYSARRSVDLIKYLQDYTNIRLVNFGGDIVSNNSEVEHSEIISQLSDWRQDTLKLTGHHSVVGNHDDDLPEYASREDLYNFLLKDEADKVTNEGSRFCYYVDNASESTRYIYLSTGFDETTQEDIRFLVNTLTGTQKDWHIVLVSHIWFNYNDTTTPTEGNVPDFAKVIFDVIDAYNARSAGSTGDVYYDFASAGARVEFCIGGHTHVDFDFRTDGGIPVILNETDSYHLRGGNKGLDKTEEASVSVIIADYDAGVIRIIRAGRGDSRTVSML